VIGLQPHCVILASKVASTADKYCTYSRDFPTLRSEFMKTEEMQ
jgi:hypothetical protein